MIFVGKRQCHIYIKRNNKNNKNKKEVVHRQKLDLGWEEKPEVAGKNSKVQAVHNHFACIDQLPVWLDILQKCQSPLKTDTS